MREDGSETRTLVYGTVVRLGHHAALIRGPSGSGKSDLALRCLGLSRSVLAPEPMELVADDQVEVERAGAELWAAPHPRLAGLLEVRGLGILKVAHHAPATLTLLVDLVLTGVAARYPDPWPTEALLGVPLPVIYLAPFEASAPAKLALALERSPWLGSER